MRFIVVFIVIISLIINVVYSYSNNLIKLSNNIRKISPVAFPSSTSLYGKKDKNKGAPKPAGQQRTSDKSEKQGQADRFDALTRKYMYTLKGLTKSLPDGTRTILKVSLSLLLLPSLSLTFETF